jgi:phosphopantetheinyl transferase (holo-ACP synthase)
VEILPDERGKPTLFLHGLAKERAKLLNANVYHITLTHAENLAMAQVILEQV